MKTITMKTLAITAAIFFSATLFTACSSDGDTTAPSISLIHPEDDDEFTVGTTIVVNAVLSDNEELASYKIQIHSNFDGHSHSHTRADETDETVDFTYDVSYTCSGTETTIIERIDIPENATTGNYHLMIYCIDASGNQTQIACDLVFTKEGEEHDNDHDHND